MNSPSLQVRRSQSDPWFGYALHTFNSTTQKGKLINFYAKLLQNLVGLQLQAFVEQTSVYFFCSFV